MATLEITTNMGCALNCSYCPQETLIKNYHGEKLLSFENYKKLLGKVPKDVEIHFSGKSEPFLNKDCINMIQYTLEQEYKISIYTTLVGLNNTQVDYLIEILSTYSNLISIFSIHLPDKNGNMKGWKKSDEYIYALEKCIVYHKNNQLPYFHIMTMDRENEVHESIQDIIQLEGMWEGHSRAQSLSDTQIENLGIKDDIKNDFPLSCKSTPFYNHNGVLPNGDVVVCCMDYGLKHILGNLFEVDYYDLYISESMNKLRVNNMKPEYNEDSICKNCSNVCSHKDYIKLFFG